MRPVAGVAAGNHVLVEGAIHAYRNSIGLSRVHFVRDVESESGVALTRVFADKRSIHPHRSAVKYSFKLDPHRAKAPPLWHIKTTQVPGNTAVVCQSCLDLPGVGDENFSPGLVARQ